MKVSVCNFVYIHEFNIKISEFRKTQLKKVGGWNNIRNENSSLNKNTRNNDNDNIKNNE